MAQDPKKIVSRESDKFMLRFPEGMREHVADAAARNRRSMNAEVLARLERTFRWDEVDHPHPAELTAEIQASAARLQELIREFALQQVDPDRGAPADDPATPDYRHLAGSEVLSTPAPTMRAPKPKG
jgi:hypothetical protein